MAGVDNGEEEKVNDRLKHSLPVDDLIFLG